MKKEINWNTYHLEYPDRYIQKSKFDRIIGQQALIVKNKYFTPNASVTCLDVGGGVNGSEALKVYSESYSRSAPFMTDLLDPNIDVKPKWIRNMVTLDTMDKYDLIVFRNSLNYIPLSDVFKIAEQLKLFQSTLIANTFIKPKEGKREYTNSNSNTRGIESFEIIHALNNQTTHESKDSQLIHRLYPNAEYPDVPIEHMFNIYSVQDIIDAYMIWNSHKMHTLSFHVYGENSMYVKIKKIE